MRIDKDYLLAVLVGITLFIIYLAGTKKHKEASIEQTKYCQIDSISSKPRYEVMPQLDYTYHTPCGLIPAGNTKRQVGDSIEIKIITIIE